MVTRDFRFEQLFVTSPQSSEGCRFIALHKRRVAHYIGRKDDRQPAFHIWTSLANHYSSRTGKIPRSQYSSDRFWPRSCGAHCGKAFATPLLQALISRAPENVSSLNIMGNFQS